MQQHILSGFKILDFTHVLAGPTATRLMVEMGAEVIKVELPPSGDSARLLPTIINGRSAYYVQQNRGKKSVCIDVKSPRGLAVIEGLIKQVDVVIENFSPGAAGRLGIGWKRVHELNPRAVMCSISAFGQQGPLSVLPGYDYIAQAYAGVTGMIGEAGGPPVLPMLALGDVNTGVHAACAIGFALLHRERSGKGQYIDMALLDMYAHSHELNIALYSMTGKSPSRAGHHHYAVCPLGLFKGKEHYLCVITLETQWGPLCTAMGHPELGRDERYNTNARRVERAPEVIAMIQAWIDSMPNDEATLAVLEAARVPCAPVLTIEEVVKHPHMQQRGTVRQINDPKVGTVTLPGMPLHFSDFPHNIPLDTSHLGENNAEVLSSLLGYSTGEIEALETLGVLQSNSAT
ncbi:MAG: CoA transferase [Gammaproteobacteria bacterium]|nr:CoA transferase [Gammaproteobacteria bacterium]